MRSDSRRWWMGAGLAVAVAMASRHARANAAPQIVSVTPGDGEAMRRQELVVSAVDAAANLSYLKLEVTDPGSTPWFSMVLTNDHVQLAADALTNENAKVQYGAGGFAYAAHTTTGTWTVVFNTGHPAWQSRVAGTGPSDFTVTATVYDSTGASATTNIPFGVMRYSEVDFNGDGVSDPAVYRKSSGKFRYSESNGNPDPGNWTGVVNTAEGNVEWVPAVGDFDGDGKADRAWFAPATGRWRIYLSSQGYAEKLPRPAFGSADDTPAPADYDGDGKTDLAVVQSDGQVRVCTGDIRETPEGASTWRPAAADFDGDGIKDPAWLDPATGKWRILRSSGGFTELLPRPVLGGADSRPVPADFDGDGKADLAIFNRTTGFIVYVRSIDGVKVKSLVGDPNWMPAVADYDGDGKADFAWFQPNAKFRIYMSSSGGPATVIPFGLVTDKPVIGDFDGDGKADPAVIQANGRIRWQSSLNSSMHVSPTGGADWEPAVADYDGDGRADFAWYVPTSQKWRILYSSIGNLEYGPRQTFGAAGARVQPGDYDGDGKADLAVVKGSGQYKICTGRNWLTNFGNPAWRSAVADYDGDGRADFGWFIPETQTWRIHASALGYAALPDQVFGGERDYPLVGDFNGDGKADLTLFRTNWTIRVKESGSGLTWTTDIPTSGAVTSGAPRWWPAIADYTGDGRSDVAWYRAGDGQMRIIKSDGDNTDGNNGAGQRVLSVALGGSDDYPLVRPYPRFGAVLGGASIDKMGPVESIAAGAGIRPHIATDNLDQPHAVFQNYISSEVVLLDKIGTSWRHSVFSNPLGSEMNFPRIVIDQGNNRAWMSCVMIQVGNINACGEAVMSRTHMDTAPSAVAFDDYRYPYGDLPSAIPLAVIDTDPKKPNKAYLYANMGYWQEFAGNGDDSPSFVPTANVGKKLLTFQAGERNMYGFSISKAPVTSGGSVWHASFVGATWWQPCGYLNTTMGGIADWLNPAVVYDGEENYNILCADMVNPKAAYMAMYSWTGQIVAQAWDGTQMLYNPGAPISMSAKGTSMRYPPQLAATPVGGAWLCWDDSDGHVKIRYIDGTTARRNGPIVDVGVGNSSSIACDASGHLHVVYVDNGFKYRRITTK